MRLHSLRSRGVQAWLAVAALVVTACGVVLALQASGESSAPPPAVQATPERPSPERPTPRRHRTQQPLFAKDSIWNKPVPEAAKLDASSTERTAKLAREIEGKIAREQLQPSIAAEFYSTPIYRVNRHQPRVKVGLPDAGDYGDPLREALAEGVPIPPDARAANGTDGHLTIYQPSTDTLWEFWRARRTGDGWDASWGGAMQGVSSNPGYFSNASWPGLEAVEGWNWGSTATSLPVAAGTMTVEELQAGEIPHALAASIPDACAELVVKPARRGDGGDTSADCMPQGAHLRLDPEIDVDQLGLTPLTETVARAAQDYGLIVRDVTRGNSLSLFAEAPRGRSPYRDATGPFDGLPPYKTLEDFPWSGLQMLEAEPCDEYRCAD